MEEDGTILQCGPFSLGSIAGTEGFAFFLKYSSSAIS